MNFMPETEVYLLSGIPFNISYNNVRDFGTIDEQTAYFLGKQKYKFDKLTYQRVTQQTIKLDINYNDLLDCNYIMFQNQSNKGKWYYAFITDYEFVSQNCTIITYQLDVFQTYLFDFHFQSTYIEREHTKRFNNDGTPVINTLDEGLAYGYDYECYNIEHVQQCDNIIWAVLVTKLNLVSYPTKLYGGSRTGKIPTTLYYYCVPIRIDNAFIDLKVNGKQVSSVQSIISKFQNDTNFVNNLVSFYYTDTIPCEVSFDGNDNITSNSSYLDVFDVAGLTLVTVGRYGYDTINKTIANNIYDKLPKYAESKLLMYPYTIVEIADQKGNTFTLKPENIARNNLPKFEIEISPSIGTEPKVAYIIKNYLGNTRDFKELSQGIINNDLSAIPILDDYTASYIQANKNSIATTNAYAIDNAQRGINQNNANNRINNAILDKQQAYSGLENGISALSSALQGNIAGAVGNIYSTIKNYDVSQGERAKMNMNNEFANENLRINAEQQIGLTQAKIADINNIPPTIRNLGNNGLFSYGNGITGIYIYYKTIRPEYVRQLTAYFKMFGYKVNRLEIPNLKSRLSYNYIKTADANIIGNIPNNYLNTLQGIFDKGITIWHTDDIGNYNLDNREVN